MVYHEFKWASPCGLHEKTKFIIKKLFNTHLTKLADLITLEYHEIPFNYTENCFTGFLAQAAYSERGYYAIMDYVDYSDKRKVYRPDLYLAISPGQKKSIVIETKLKYISLYSPKETIINEIKETLRDASDQMDKHNKRGESTYRCCLGVFYIYCKPLQWNNIIEKRSWNHELAAFQRKMEECIKNDTYSNIPINFFYWYFLSTSEKSHKQILRKKVPKKEEDVSNLGCVVAGNIRSFRREDFT